MSSSRVVVALCRMCAGIGISLDCLCHLGGGDTFVQAFVRGSVEDLVTFSTILGSALYTVQQGNVFSVPVADECLCSCSCSKRGVIRNFSKTILGKLLQSVIKLKQTFHMGGKICNIKFYVMSAIV